ncbi:MULTISPECIES: class III extradiol ring-cleavage dioxygenase [unclassified Paenibacillus]|uniref:DODA-type extradiol aromatic ring-opening family dioxygenase n=1 Tax=unclassified Paenibacillus TaxID=185978 RepID=UPI0024074E89|nr:MULTISPECIES: class III extradiol ring-cleavage dioxygenase [unclassified Paenibacillus]MDF9844608.1 4,5-DOPA dioxygenase extradiol [Paenibacillus sp. PastF-2]MDF9851214.1 4,5-DOPA dioxygenase extradiol [Paenibacillus sp. PastM-2]MDF9857793.1 4,5-DOPA dioxygenase extradiol [Paenibacillus sp. PastF-1]MDH6483063.1 4,5-DOPA dioxygenase extradiol [Paenibacillus sp. PastH-2]MDH6510473.1 4,5-DOPA dioxygenase extradiol [Paenibacillus sp. PastM-3]
MKLPAFFIAHGSPLLALEDNEYTRFLERLGQDLGKPRGIVVFSAHWDSPEQLITVDAQHEAQHDFYGFPEEMYSLSYPAPGDPALSSRISELFSKGNLPHQPVLGRGLDHGVWVILSKMFPLADIPVVALSVDSLRSPKEQYKIGQMLAPLREEGILLLGSGGLVHNLRMLKEDDQPEPWALEFDAWLAEGLQNWDLPSLFAYEKKAPHVRAAVPSYGKEHFVPLFYIMGTADTGRQAQLMIQAYQYGTLSLNCWMVD